MIYHLHPALRRLIALTLVILVAACLYLAAIDPLAEYVSSLQDQIQQERQSLGRLQTVLADPSQQIKNTGDLPNLAEFVLEGESDPVKQANLQTKLADLVASRGLKLRSARNLPPRDRGGARLVGLQFHLSGSIEAFQHILYAIEHQKPFLIVDALQITPMPTANDEEKGFLDARIDIFGAASLRGGS